MFFMIKDVELGGKVIKVEFILPDKIKQFLLDNNLDESLLLEDYKWEQSIHESLLDENYKVKNNFQKAKLVINYLHTAQDNQIRVSPQNFVKGKPIGGGNWAKGTFFKNFSIGYSIFTE